MILRIMPMWFLIIFSRCQRLAMRPIYPNAVRKNFPGTAFRKSNTFAGRCADAEIRARASWLYVNVRKNFQNHIRIFRHNSILLHHRKARCHHIHSHKGIFTSRQKRFFIRASPKIGTNHLIPNFLLA